MSQKINIDFCCRLPPVIKKPETGKTTKKKKSNSTFINKQIPPLKYSFGIL